MANTRFRGLLTNQIFSPFPESLRIKHFNKIEEKTKSSGPFAGVFNRTIMLPEVLQCFLIFF